MITSSKFQVPSFKFQVWGTKKKRFFLGFEVGTWNLEPGTSSKGFTLTEVMVVIVIIGILAVIGVPQYTKTVETSKSDEAQSLLQLVYSANKMYMINNCPSSQDCYRVGTINCGTGADTGDDLTDDTSCADSDPQKYTQNYNDPVRSYIYYAANSGSASTYVVCAKRTNGASPGTDASPYKNWRYKITTDGVLCGYPSTAPLPAGSSTCSSSFSCP
ncbi:MAG: prepilin-type N-terminal cleavage/methylation domain-containing protein [Elusimicrobia bacterium]|nr:prepilin-type N-terminal cleavage/methylation domain-containing protein [Elusimicrobiota bacterium]